MLGHVPLMIVPFILYNLGLAGLFGGAAPQVWDAVLFDVAMVSGGLWTMTLGDLMVVVALALLFVEVVKATRTSNASVVDHLLSTFVFVAFLIEFLLVRAAAHALFFTLTVIAFVDVLAGFAVSLRGARRDLSLDG
ncbi:hypothetical protein N1F89_19195 [Aquibium sp. A9E412]|uniref:hypothetical protein n=1 Tax=Aquibium sp. A9E412 TaxID=2976767 RepID=UPI0025B0A869|nr:hypothetical protein [Aquibium sp. A9E412]MDN2568356.1 hypothetical protein [Aquibium sp. A9E412]